MSLESTATPTRPSLFRPAQPSIGGAALTLEDLHHHLQTAIYVEMTTIPLYLYAFYSIKKDGKPGKQARRLISDVFKEEMLHLALASNTLYSLGKAPKLYSPETIPVFPTNILFTPVRMNLRDGRQENIDTFVAIEAAADPVETDDSEDDVLPDYKSIGLFYEAIKRELANHQSSIHEGKHQIKPDDGIWFEDGLVVISDLEQANKALDLIVTQGEGADAGSHHSKFVTLRTSPNKWEWYPVVENPQTETTYHDKVFYEVSRTFDAVYCYLLLNIERLYQVSGGPRNICNENILFIMQGVLSDIAEFLVDQNFDENTVAGPCFNYYALDAQDPLSSLKKEIAAAVARYEGQGPKQDELKRIQKSIEKIKQVPAPDDAQA